MDGTSNNGFNMTSKSTTTFLLCAIAVLSFMAPFFSYTLSASAYAMVLFVLTFLFAFGRLKITIERNWCLVLWIIAITAALVSLFRSHRSANSVLDVVCLCCCLLMVLFYCKSCEGYVRMMHVICWGAMFFASGVLLQRFFPTIYNFVIGLFPSEYAIAVRAGADDLVSSGKRGFTTNTGATAGYICGGIIALVSLRSRYLKNRTKYVIMLIALFLALLFSGKRGPAIFLVLALFVHFILPERGTKRMRKYWIGFLIILAGTIIYAFLGSYLASIPLVREMVETVNGLILGDDVSSLRLSLYKWAFELFKRNPLFGIGWGDYRSTVAGNVSLFRALDVHNIYLQLLCEDGIVGFVCFALLFLVFWIVTKNAYCVVIKNDSEQKTMWLPALSFSFSYQTFFLLYGMTGNVLYDQHYQILYGLSCAIVLAYNSYQKQMSTVD